MARLVLDHDLVRALAGDRYYARGVAYQREGAVATLHTGPSTVDATVVGTHPYRVRATLTAAGLEATCSCPLGVDGVFCKHAVAVALAWLEEAGDDRPAPDLAAFLARQPTSWLVDRLLRVAAADPVLRAEWETLASQGQASGIDLAGFRRQLERALIVPEYLDWDETGGYVHSAYQVLTSIEDLLASGLAASSVELAEDALRLMEPAVEVVDQNGEMTDLLEAAQDLHLRACQVARPDPVVLAERLTRWSIDSEWGVFANATRDYADVYGAAGLRRCREVVSAEWAALPALAPGERAGYDHRRTALDRLRLILADTAEERVEVLSRDLSTPDRFVAVAAALSDDGQFDEALRWLTDAREAFAGADERVDRAVADILRRAGRPEQAAEAEWDCFRRQPGLRAYQRLAEQLRPLAGWERWRAQALAVLERPARPGSWPTSEFAVEHGNSRLVEVLLWDGDVEAAWAAAELGGCNRTGWLRAARARAASHPAESIPVLRRVIDEARPKAASRKTYSVIARDLAELRTWHQQAGTAAEFADYLRRLRADHRNRPAFQDELNLAGLS